ncbi:MAG: putative heavy-metal chelation [Candidatus Nitrotoga sp. SPKER]|nr:MAG: putative heavy-metal chelation [Candidatus Nitrotoga sp. SPKER]
METRSKTASLIAELRATALDHLGVEAGSLQWECATLGIFFTNTEFDNPVGDLRAILKSLSETVSRPSLINPSLSVLGGSAWSFDDTFPRVNLHEDDAFDALLLALRQRVALVGTFPPYMHKLIRSGYPFDVLELDMTMLALDKLPFSVPPERVPEVIPRVDLFVNTATIPIDSTLTGLLNRLWLRAEAGVIGPTAMLIFEPYARPGITVVGGTRILAPDEILELLDEVGSSDHFFAKTIKRAALRLSKVA